MTGFDVTKCNRSTTGRNDSIRSSAARLTRSVSLIVICAVVLSSVPAYTDKAPNEYEIKAAFLYNFAKFVDWPADAFADASSPLVIGVLGGYPFGNALDQAVAGKSINGHRLEIKRFRELRDLRGCQILFVSSTEESHIGRILGTVKNWHTLTVGETDQFAQRGGVMNFYLEDRKVRFEVNLDAARRANLRISSKLLKLARIVKD